MELLTLPSKKGVPHLLCNATLNDYKQNPRDPNFYQFCIGSAWTGCEITGYAATSYMDMTWERAMAISGAAFATSMGRVNIEAIRSNETLFAMIGLTLGDWIRFPTSKSFRSIYLFIPY